MASQGKVFVSHTHEDNALCGVLEHALRDWGVEFWVDRTGAQAGAVLKDEILSHMSECDVLVRLCTQAASRSKWVHRELGMLLAFQVERSKHAAGAPAPLISVCFDGYEPDGLEQAYLYIDAREKPNAAWLDAVRRALGAPMGAVVFDHNDNDYLWWVETYRDGYVINADRRPHPDNLILHRSRCGFISSRSYPSGVYAERSFIKICGLERADLERWARQKVSASAQLSAGCACMTYG